MVISQWSLVISHWELRFFKVLGWPSSEADPVFLAAVLVRMRQHSYILLIPKSRNLLVM